MIDFLRRPDPDDVPRRGAEPVALLARVVAQEFNNLLQTIGARSEMLLARLDPGDPRREPVEEIRKAVHEGAQLTRELLEISLCRELRERLHDPDDPGDGPS